MAAALRPGVDEIGETRKRWASALPRFTPAGPSAQLMVGKARPEIQVCTDTLGGVRAAVEAGCHVICFEPVFSGPYAWGTYPGTSDTLPDCLPEAAALCRASGRRFVWKLPRITDDQNLVSIIPFVKDAYETGIRECMVDNAGTAIRLRKEIPGLTLLGSPGLNIFNHVSVRVHRELFRQLTLSPELSGDEVRVLVQAARAEGEDPALALIVQGSIESVISENCFASDLDTDPSKSPGETPVTFAIRDQTGRVFPVSTDSQCRTHIRNAIETCLVDHLPDILQSGIDALVIDARGRPPRYTATMTRTYHEALTIALTGDAGAIRSLSLLKEEAKEISLGGITAGYFLRGTGE